MNNLGSYIGLIGGFWLWVWSFTSGMGGAKERRLKRN